MTLLLDGSVHFIHTFITTKLPKLENKHFNNANSEQNEMRSFQLSTCSSGRKFVSLSNATTL